MIKWSNRILAYIALAIFMVIAVGNSTIVARDKMDAITIADVLEKEKNLSIEKWSVFAREINNEITTKKEFENKVSALKKEYPEFHWNVVWDHAVWKAEASLPHIKDNVTEFIRIVTTEEHNNSATYIIYEVKGQQWNKESSTFLQTEFQSKLNYIFQENPTVFSCIGGSINDNMDSVFATEMDRLLNLFEAKKVEGVQEENFSSISAHSRLFTQMITNKEINVQVGIRRDGLGQKTSFVIGTPIITFEY